MTKVAILPEVSEQGEKLYRAIASGHQSLAKTAGAALDALTAQLPADEAGTLVVVQSQQSDEFFTAQQQERLRGLMARWRAARDAGAALEPTEQAELEALVDAEVQAAGRRAAALSAALGR
jgi:glutamate/tyrosine decarboxylase-like PLP-dependent enzyme